MELCRWTGNLCQRYAFYAVLPYKCDAYQYIVAFELTSRFTAENFESNRYNFACNT